jgi:hypothetical protein
MSDARVAVLRPSFSTTFYSQKEREFSFTLLDHYTILLKTGRIQPARIAMIRGGLRGIEDALGDLRHGRAPGGYKLVAKV